MNNNLEPEKIKNHEQKNREVEAKLKRYTSPEGISTTQLEFGLWYVRNKNFLKKILNGFLIIVAVVSWSYTIYGFFYYLVFGLKADQKLVSQLVSTKAIGHEYVSKVSPVPLAASPIGIIKSGEKKYDFYIQLKNVNEKWWAEFDYYFIASGQRTQSNGGYIFPQESKYLFSLAQEFTGGPTAAELVVENIRWQRVNLHKFPDWKNYYQNHLQIESSDIVFTPAGSSLVSEKMNYNQLSFKVTNRSVFNYWSVNFAIVLHSSGSIVNINYYTLNEFMSGQTRAVEIIWPGNLNLVDKIEIIPDINLMRDDIYIKYEGGIGLPK